MTPIIVRENKKEEAVSLLSTCWQSLDDRITSECKNPRISQDSKQHIDAHSAELLHLNFENGRQSFFWDSEDVNDGIKSYMADFLARELDGLDLIRESSSHDKEYFQASGLVSTLQRLISIYIGESEEWPDKTLQHLNGIFYSASWYLESLLILGEPSLPHLTIFTNQPHLGRPNELLFTELWILCYWARKYARRAVGYTAFPIRLISMYDQQARIVWAQFSIGYVFVLATSKGTSRGFPIDAKIFVDDYYTLDHAGAVSKLLLEVTRKAREPSKYAESTKVLHSSKE